MLLLLVVAHPSARANSTIFGGGPFYTGGTATMNALRASGYTTVMLWCIHVNASNGDLIYNDILVVSNGAYVGNPAWPGQLATLKTAPTSVKRIEVSVGSWGVNDFLSIQTLMNQQGTNTSSILYRNFKALKEATGADAIDFDDETLYDVATAVKFGRMLASIGYKVTLCPYTNPSFWQNTYQQLGPGIVDAVYLQCYAGGAGNNPATWNNYFGGLKVEPGMWSRHGGGCADGSSAAQVATQMRAWRTSAGIQGGFMWLYDDMLACTAGGSAADYARAINEAMDPLAVRPEAGFSTMAAPGQGYLPASTAFTLTNSGTGSLGWTAINTSSWLQVSAAAGNLNAGAARTATVSLVPAIATNLPPAVHLATVVFSNTTSGASQARVFSLNTAVANWPLAVTGFNAGLIASNNATAATPGASAFDGPNNYAFYQAGLPGATRGLPLDGVFSSQADPATAFRLGRYGSTTNALLLSGTFPKSGTLRLAQPRALSSLAILATSANGGGQGTFVLNFTDGTKSPVLRFNAQDWFFVPTNVALQGFGRLRLGTSLTAEDNGASNPNLYQTTVPLAELGLARSITSITFTNPVGAGANQTTAILALSGLPADLPMRPPANLTALPGSNATVRLSWSASPGAIRYLVHRSTTSGGPHLAMDRADGLTFTDTNVVNGTTYYYTVAAMGPENTGPASAEVSATPGAYRGWVLDLGAVAYWPLDDASGTVARELVRGSNGVHSGGVTPGSTGFFGDGFAAPHRATAYNGTSGFTTLPRPVGSTNFSVAFWVLTASTGGSPQWYSGRGLVDGEVGGTTDDFGVALVGGKVGFGVGNPDYTLASSRSINNGQWRFVVVTRASASGALRIYIDGTLDASGTGPIGAKTAPPALRLGGIQAGGNFLNGRLADVACFDRVLTADQVVALHSAATGLFYGIPLSQTWTNGRLTLDWPGNGRLLEAPTPTGPWTTNTAVAPFEFAPGQDQRFYRLLIR